MCGGGGSTTNVTEETGLGDDQFENLTAGQETIRSDISSFGNAAEDRYNTTTDTLSTMASDNTQGFADVNSGIAGLGTDVSGLRSYAEDQFGYLEDENSVLLTGVADTRDAVTDGFANTDSVIEAGFNTVDQQFEDTDTNINNRFDATDESIGTGFNNLTDTVNTNFDDTNSAIDTGFTDTNTNIDELGTTLGNQLTDTSSNVLTGQDAISKLIEKYGGNAATYYQDLAKGQSDIKTGQGTMQTAFDGYLTDFGNYTNLANQTRTSLGDTVVGGFETMGQVLGNQATANADGFSSVGDAVTGVGNSVADVTSDVASASADAETNFGDIASSISGVGTDVAGVGSAVGDAASDSNTNFAGVATDIASGFNDQSTEGKQRKADFVDTLTSVQDILQTDTGNLDATIKANYQSVVSSFDDQGNLITDTVTAEGTTITRALSEQGDLFIAEFDANGKRLTQQTLDLNSLLNNVSTFETGVNDQFTSIFGDAEFAAESRQSILDAFSVTDGLIGDVGAGVSADLTNNFDLLSDAFDAQGNFLADSIDENGNTITRSLDENGNLITKSFDSTNTLIDETSLNIGDISTQLNSMQTGLGDQLTSAFTSLADGSADANANIVSILGTVGTQIGDVGTGLSSELSSNLDSLTSAFDAQGNLIREDIGENGETITRALDTQGNLVTTAIGANGEIISQSSMDILDVSNQLNGVQQGLGDQLALAFDALSNGNADASEGILTTLGNITSQVDTLGSGLQSSLATDFASLKSSFDEQGNLIRSEITEAGTEIQRDLDSQGNLITTELSSTGEVISQTSLNIADISTQLNGMQAGLGDTITNAFDGIQNSSEELRANLVGNLAGLRNIMTTQGDTLGADLQEKFMALSSSFDDNGDLIRSAVDAQGDFIFRELNANGELVISTIDDATGQLIESNKFNADLLTTDFDSRFNSTEEFLRAIDSSISQVGGDIDAGLLGMASGLEEGFTSRFDELSDQERAGRQEFNNRLTQVRALLEEDVADLDDGLRGRMGELSKAFDGEGKLIANAIDANGNMLKRTIDDSGNLVLSTYSRMNGQILDQQALDINRLMKEISNRRVSQGSNANMGGQSPTAGAPAPASVYSGFASPYAQTY